MTTTKELFATLSFQLLSLITMSNETSPYPPPYDPEYAASSYTLLPDHHPQLISSPAVHRRPLKVFAGILLTAIILLSLVIVILDQAPEVPKSKVVNHHYHEKKPSTLKSSGTAPETLIPPSRGVSQGVSEKAFRDVYYDAKVSFSWTNTMLSWQRTAYHFQPERNWMNDPNGPLFHMGWYHLFYQYNPDSAIWGNITWGHAVSRDLIHWLYLPSAMVPDRWYDINGVWTGSATVLPDGKIVVIYTGDAYELAQVQNLAYPANLSDPLLLDWVKYPGNPVIVPPPGIVPLDFRDPTTAWFGPDEKWYITIGSKVNKTGISFVYETTNFTSYSLVDGVLHAVPGTGMWECVDFYPVSTVDTNGLDTSANGPNIKHVLKASLEDNQQDFYAIGTYDFVKNKWTPDNPEWDVGIGLRLDYGNYYASKTFYDQNKQRRILWGWIGETDSEADDLLKGWASVQTIPRTVVFDKKTGTHLLQWPVEEVESLRLSGYEFNEVKIKPGSVVPLHIDLAAQLDIVASFKVNGAVVKATMGADVGYDCCNSGSGAAARGALGPFGLIVVADEILSELTPVYFYIANGSDGRAQTHFCADQSRSSLAPEVGKYLYGSQVPVLDGEDFTMRLLVDHSIVESFGQGGRTVITSRIYPTRAMNGAARVFLFNNATGASVTASVKIWNMGSANLHKFPLDQL